MEILDARSDPCFRAFLVCTPDPCGFGMLVCPVSPGFVWCLLACVLRAS